MHALARSFPRGSPRRSAALTASVLAVAYLVATFGLPKGTPGGILFNGVVAGCVNALIAVGIIVVYRSARIVNFAQLALGALGGGIAFRVVALLHWNFWAGFVTGIVVSALVALVVELVLVRRFFDAPRLVLTVVTIVLAIGLSTATSLASRIPGMPDQRIPSVARTLATGRMPTPFAGRSITIAPLSFGFAAFFTLAMTALALLGIALLFKRMTLGRSVRAAAENADRVMLLGINVRMLSSLVWVIAGVLAGLATILQGMNTTFIDTGTWAPQILIPGLAAAVIARMRSIPVALAASIAIAAIQGCVFWSFGESTWVDVVLLGVIAGALIVQRRGFVRSEEGMTSSWDAVKELRPVPRELLDVPGVRRARRGVFTLALIAVAVLPFASSPAQTNLASLIVIQTIIALSLVVLTGWAGQVSLGQFAFVAIGAVLGAKMTTGLGVPFWLAMPLAAALTAGFAALVGLPALRIRGAFLAVTTLSFAVVVQRVLFNKSYFGWLLTDRIERPSLFFLHFASERNYYFLCVAVALGAIVVVKRLRASRPGRVLIALREDETGVQTFGIDVARTRLAAFALSGALAGVAGVLFVHHQRALDAASYGSDVSVAMFVMAMIGGITSVTGAVLGAAYIGTLNYLVTDPLVKVLGRDVMLLLLLTFAPGGLAGIAYGIRDAMLRIVATRRHIAVPSLFADYDPEAARARKQVLGELIPGRGLEALPPDRRYARRSELYQSMDDAPAFVGGDR